jgi:tRNA pseudouridine13 synthase
LQLSCLPGLNSVMTKYSLELPYAHGLNRSRVDFKIQPADFLVEEELGFELTGQGEHLWVWIEKTGLNTADVARQMAKLVGTRPENIGYAGLKDRVGVTRQWFSIPTEADLPTDAFAGVNGLKMLSQKRNGRKLRRGSHRSNHFTITLRNVSETQSALDTLTTLLQSKGVPNYFGKQRFGHEGKNLNQAEALFAGSLARSSRYQRGLYLSAARAFLFNQILASRVQSGNWDQTLSGDVMALAGSASVFKSEQGDPELLSRLNALDIHPTGPLWGAGSLATSEEAGILESSLADNYVEFTQGLEKAGMKQERRSLRLIPENLRITPADEKCLVLEFTLPKGTFATSVLREMVEARGL